MRQPGIGDWWFDGSVLHVRAIDNEDAFLVAVHELVEAWLCDQAGVDQKDVDAFDLAFEAEGHDPEEEPGDDPRAPYRAQHRDAMIVEHLVARMLGVTGYGVIR